MVSRQKIGRSGSNATPEQLSFALEEEGEARPEPAKGPKPSAAVDPMRALTQSLMEQDGTGWNRSSPQAIWGTPSSG